MPQYLNLIFLIAVAAQGVTSSVSDGHGTVSFCAPVSKPRIEAMECDTHDGDDSEKLSALSGKDMKQEGMERNPNFVKKARADMEKARQRGEEETKEKVESADANRGGLLEVWATGSESFREDPIWNTSSNGYRDDSGGKVEGGKGGWDTKSSSSESCVDMQMGVEGEHDDSDGWSADSGVRRRRKWTRGWWRMRDRDTGQDYWGDGSAPFPVLAADTDCNRDHLWGKTGLYWRSAVGARTDVNFDAEEDAGEAIEVLKDLATVEDTWARVWKAEREARKRDRDGDPSPRTHDLRPADKNIVREAACLSNRFFSKMADDENSAWILSITEKLAGARLEDIGVDPVGSDPVCPYYFNIQDAIASRSFGNGEIMQPYVVLKYDSNESTTSTDSFDSSSSFSSSDLYAGARGGKDDMWEMPSSRSLGKVARDLEKPRAASDEKESGSLQGRDRVLSVFHRDESDDTTPDSLNHPKKSNLFSVSGNDGDGGDFHDEISE